MSKRQSKNYPPLVVANPAMASRQNSENRGVARAARYEPLILSEWASKGGKAVLEKYGREYFVELRKRRPTKAQSAEAAAKAHLHRKKCIKSIAARENGRKGGQRRAELFYPECHQARAREGGIATRNRYGNEFFREIRKKRRYYRKGYTNIRTRRRIRDEALQKAKREQNPIVKYLWPLIINWESYSKSPSQPVIRHRDDTRFARTILLPNNLLDRVRIACDLTSRKPTSRC
jgi:hypothetical protein